jgi:peptidoglycan/xylan/chitin deacetylase (PgdA/CDA1 family)
MGGFALVKNSRWRRERLLILAYHGISIEDEHEWNPELYLAPEALHARFRMIRDGGYTALPLGEAVRRLGAGELPTKAVVLTFDDGTHDFFERALPIINEFNFPATVYVTTYYSEHNLPVFPVACSYILWKGRQSALDCGYLINEDLKLDLSDENHRTYASATIVDFANRNELSAEAKNDLLARLARQLKVDFEGLLAKRILHIMTPTEIAQVAAAGIDVQLHTHRHRTPKDRVLFLREIRDNRRAIEQCTKRVATHFCYPSGVYQPEFFPWLRESDVMTATTSDPALATRKSDMLLLPRLADTSSLSPIEFEGWLAGVSQVLPQRVRAR